MPTQAELIERYADVEDPLYELERESRYLTFRRVADVLGPANGRSLLDVGAYCGYFLDVARERGFRAEGIELSRWAVEQARRLGVTVHRETLGERAATGARYDVVTLWDVIEHVADPRTELEAAFRLLNPGGALYVATIDAGSPVARLLGRRWPWLMDMHLYYFNRETIAVLLDQVGFDVETIGHYTHVVSVDYLLRKVSSSFGPLRPVSAGIRKVVPRDARLPVNVGDNMLVVARRRPETPEPTDADSDVEPEFDTAGLNGITNQ
jgi:2-polyprenyl-3-methyl-5-hydroxy-6-metoxy-1,4-benzoquinol methylase